MSPGGRKGASPGPAAAGFEHVSLDLIYGTPGESDEDWNASLRSAVSAGPDHISAYSLIVEEGTRLAARIGRGELAAPDDDVMADRYLAADELLSAAGLRWYEVSNWAASPDAMCRHNLLYWTGGDWWGVGPGAHSHVARNPVVERAAPGRVRGQDRGRGESGAGARDPDPGGAPDRTDHAADPAGGRLPAGRADPGRARGRGSGSADGLADPAAHAQARVVLTRAAGCWPTR